MGFGDIHGKARVNPNRPRGFAVSDFSGKWTNRHRLVRQMEWQGPQLSWTGMLVPGDELDEPQPQLRTIRLPPDPVPLVNPRPENFQAIDRPQGLSQFVMWAGGFPLNYGVELMDGNGNPILDNNGQPILIDIGYDGTALLAQLSQMTGIPVPGTINNYNTTIATANTSQVIVPAQASRSYLAVFNPCTAPIWVNFGTAANVAPSLTIGCGGCLFWATAQGYGAPTASAVQIYSNFSGIPVYAYAAP